MIEFSELEMSNKFDIALKNASIRGIPSFEIVYKELVCQQGIPDFVALPSDKFVTTFDFSTLSSIESSSMILSFLKYRAGRKKSYIKKKTALSDVILNKTLKELITNGFIIQDDNLYYLSPEMKLQNDSVWAFELKLSNWKRALFQALQNKTFANFSIVVFPFEKERILRQNIENFINLNVGVLLFDFNSSEAKWLYHPRKEKAASKWQTLFLLGKVSSQKSQETFILPSNIAHTE